ncbi:MULTISPECIES: phosphate acetyltransferase [Capnocytophaga]|uniref:Phosphate acetyltransferase n=1 Tax=Capnocytophaga canis TaxID=1848903 RepID=A0A0B7HV85_9FLAO|nr:MULTISPECIES: phosphate acetyltransferase [Capnocytophaga]ATA73714.1 phosphate acetyltransferase [Capnocytophaga sp. H4358]ATA75860.1 phosphate acetyltransferase [Capnocytophaga sp. H2931]RIY36564.1 phosphate acetyltransferase [Capnocytophaga canis]CEN42539.1 Phosphate acetyltransferase [Capnocytophaga canis]CEN46508.1 Phosphate acetyltransferase [Capnocytophaga canis]
MNKSVYIITSDAYSGKSLVTLGVMQMIMRNTAKVGYFKPILESKTQKDNHITTVLSHFQLDMDYEDAYVYTRSEVTNLQNKGKIGEVYDTIIKRYKALENKFDFVLVEGTDLLEDSNVFDIKFNASLAQNLNIPALVVLKDSFLSEDELVNQIQIEVNTLLEQEVQILGVFVNKVKNYNDSVKQRLEKEFKDIHFTFIPREEDLSRPTLKEIADELGAKFLYKGDDVNMITKKTIIGAMQLHNFLNHVSESCLAVIPADRSDLIVGSLTAHISSNYPRIAGLVLSGGIVPERSIIKILDGTQKIIPIMLSKSGTFETATRIGNIKSKIYPESAEKIKLSIQLFEKYADVSSLNARISSFKSDAITPRMFQYNMVQKARKAQRHIVLPEGTDDRILTAASQLAVDELVYLTVLGDAEKIMSRVNELGLKWDERRIFIVNPVESPKYEEYVQKLYDIRKSKGLELSQARDLMLDVSYFGTMMVFVGDADGMVSGAVNTTAHTIRPSLQFVKTKPNVNTVSSVFFMLLNDRVLVYGDCAIVPNPTAEQLAEIAISSAESAKAFGIEPRVALLSYSSGSSGTGADVDKVRTATEIVKSQCPDLLVEGPIQYDAAVDPKVGKSKMPNSKVAGQANVLIFPDLNTGNNTYKAVQRETGALAIGPMLQGLKKPVNDLSRGATIPDIYNTVLITAIQSVMEE